jgi:hypothetical protein
MFKKFNSKFSVICEEETSRYRQGGYLMGDFAVINKKALNHPEIKNKPSNFIDVVKELINSDLPLKISAVKSERPESQHDLYAAGSLMTKIYIDLVQEYAPGLFKNAITLPAEVVDVVNPTSNNWSPKHPESWKYDNKEQIEAVPVKDANDSIEHQTQGNKRKTATKDTKGITKGTAKGAKGAKPVEYKESLEAEKNDSELLAEAYDLVHERRLPNDGIADGGEPYTPEEMDIMDREDKMKDVAVGSEPSFRDKIASRTGELGSEPEVIPSEVDVEISADDNSGDIFEKYGIYAKHFDALNTKAGQKALTAGEKHFYKTFEALINGDATVGEMKVAHRDWMEEDEMTEADKVRAAYLNIQAKKD